MGRFIKLSILIALLLVALLSIAVSCGRGKHSLTAPDGGLQSTDSLPRPGGGGFPTADSPPVEQSLDEILTDLDALACPAGVDDALWSELKSALEEALLSKEESRFSNRDSRSTEPRLESRDSGGGRLVATPPTGEANRVNDLSLTDNGDGTYTLSWHYRNLGDYDQDGVVAIGDITPLAQHFGEAVPADDLNRNSIQAVIDGSGNGVVDIADITAIAQRLATSVAGYTIEGAQALDGAYIFVQAAPLDAASADGRLLLESIVSQVGFKCVRVSPADASGAAGESSNAIFMPATGRGDWYMFGRDAQHSHTSPYTGPKRNPVVKWKLDTGERLSSTSEQYPCPVIAADGTVYVIGGDGALYAVDPDGSVKWQSEMSASRASNPALGTDGTIYVLCGDGMLRALSPSGEAQWEYDTSQYFGGCKSSPLIGADGSIYIGTLSLFYRGPGDFTLGGFLHAVNPDGTVRWLLFGSGGFGWNAPAMSADGTIYCPGDGGLHAVSPDGSVIWLRETTLYRFGPSVDSSGNIYLRNADNDLMAFSSDGNSLLDIDMGDDYPTWSMPVVGADGTIFIGNNNAYLYAFNPDGSVKWRYETNYDVASTAVLDAEGRIYFGCDGGFLYCLTADGNLIWRLDVGSSVQSALAMSADGTLYFVTYDGFLCAVAEDPGGEPPEAAMTVSPMWGPAPLDVSFGASLSTDPDGSIVRYEWDLDGDSKFDRSTETAQAVSHTFAENGQYTVTLRVTDDQGLTNTAIRTVIVRDGDARGDWWMFGHDPRHTRQSSVVGPQTATLKWKCLLGNRVFSSPALSADGTVYVGSWDNSLCALNPDGTIKWNYETEWPVRSSPAIAPSGVVYVGCDDSHFYAINPDGTLNWRKRLGYTIVSSPAVGPDGTVYVGCSDTYIYALFPDGNLKWSFKTGDWVFSSPAVGDDGTVYAGSTDGYLYALGPNGSLKWSFRTGELYASTCVTADGKTYIAAAGWLYALNRYGVLSWTYSLQNNYPLSSPGLRRDGIVYFIDAGRMLAIASDGAVEWSGDLIDPRHGYELSAPSIGADGVVYMGNDIGVSAISPDGSILWQYGMNREVVSSPAIADDGTLYVGCYDGYLYAFADESV